MTTESTDLSEDDNGIYVNLEEMEASISAQVLEFYADDKSLEQLEFVYAQGKIQSSSLERIQKIADFASERLLELEINLNKFQIYVQYHGNSKEAARAKEHLISVVANIYALDKRFSLRSLTSDFTEILNLTLSARKAIIGAVTKPILAFIDLMKRTMKTQLTMIKDSVTINDLSLQALKDIRHNVVELDEGMLNVLAERKLISQEVFDVVEARLTKLKLSIQEEKEEEQKEEVQKNDKRKKG